jgi:ERCC4-type nuclease
MKTYILFDCREKALINTYQEKYNIKKKKAKPDNYLFIDDEDEDNNITLKTKNNNINMNNEFFNIKQLDIGDIWICNNQVDNEGSYIPYIIIERKEIKDYMSSIKTGRFHEQKSRLKNTVEYYKNQGHECKGMYIIEGNLPSPSKKIRNTPASIIYSSMLSVSLDNDIGIFQTKSVGNTAELIDCICKKLEKKTGIFWDISKGNDINIKTKIIGNDGMNDVNNINITKKRSYDTKLKIQTEMLTCIRGVSKNISLILLSHFGDLKKISDAIQNNKFMDECLILKQNGRRLSKKMLERIIELFK